MSTLSTFNQDWESLQAIVTQEHIDSVKAVKASMNELTNDFPNSWQPYQITVMQRLTEDLIKIMDEIKTIGVYPES